MVLRKWWHRGPAHCRRICHAHCKSGPRDGVQETLFLLLLSVIDFFDELERPDWRSRHFDSLWAPDLRTHIDHVGRTLSILTPTSRLPRVQLHATKLNKWRVRSGHDAMYSPASSLMGSFVTLQALLTRHGWKARLCLWLHAMPVARFRGTIPRFWPLNIL